MRAALGAGHGVDLVHDDGVHLAERFPRPGGEHQEEGLGGGDQDVRRVAEQGAAVGGGGIAGPDPDGDQGSRQVQPFGSLGDADEGGAEVAFDVDAKRLERGDVQYAGFPLGLPCPGLPGLGTGRRLVKARQHPSVGQSCGGCSRPGHQEPVQRPEERGQGLA
jgi:hypothetical protein